MVPGNESVTSLQVFQRFFLLFWVWFSFWFNDSFLSLPIYLHQQIVFSSKTPFVTRDLLDKLSRQILVMENIAEISTENLGNITSLTDGKKQLRAFPADKDVPGRVCCNNHCAELTSSAGDATVARAGSGSPGGAAVTTARQVSPTSVLSTGIQKYTSEKRKDFLFSLMCRRRTDVVGVMGWGYFHPWFFQILLPSFFPEERKDLHYNIRGIGQLLDHFHI